MNGQHSTEPAPAARRLAGRKVSRPALTAAIATGVALLLLIVMGMSSTLGAVAAVGAAVLLLGLVSLGLSRTAEALVLLGALLVPMNDLHTSGAASFVTAADAAFVLGFTLMIPDLLGRQLRLPPAFVIGVAGVGTTALISSMLSEDPASSLNSTARLVVGAFGLAVLIAWWGPELKKVVVLAWAYVLGNVASVGFAMLGGSATADGRRVGLTEHPNIFGLCALLGLSLVPFLISQTARSYRWLPALMGAVCLGGIWTSGSRGALAALLVVAVIFPLLSRSVPAALGLLAGFAVMLALSERLLSETSSGNALGRLLGQGSASGSDEAREQIAEFTLGQFRDNPILGVGLADVLDAHIIYLQVIAALGIVGLAFFLLVIWGVVQPAVVTAPPYAFLALPALSYATLGWVTPVMWDRYIWVALAVSLLAPRLAGEALPDDQAAADHNEPTTRRAAARTTSEQE
ncbi:MAG: O-antigen ligase family protein [Aeromicrobium sp.]